MSLEAIFLAFASAVKPTSLAVVYTLLAGHEPRRLLTVYLVTGAAFSITVGIVLVTLMDGAGVPRHSSDAGAIVFVLAGTASLGVAAGMRWRPERLPRRERNSDKPSPIVSRLRNASPKMAAAAGVATHPPGLFYLVGLNAIAAGNPGVADGVLQVLIFNVIWFSGVIGSLVFFILRPEATRAGLTRFETWSAEHERALMVALFAVAGAFLVVRGTLELLD